MLDGFCLVNAKWTNTFRTSFIVIFAHLLLSLSTRFLKMSCHANKMNLCSIHIPLHWCQKLSVGQTSCYTAPSALHSVIKIYNTLWITVIVIIVWTDECPRFFTCDRILIENEQK